MATETEILVILKVELGEMPMGNQMYTSFRSHILALEDYNPEVIREAAKKYVKAGHKWFPGPGDLVPYCQVSGPPSVEFAPHRLMLVDPWSFTGEEIMQMGLAHQRSGNESISAALIDRAQYMLGEREPRTYTLPGEVIEYADKWLAENPPQHLWKEVEK